MCMLNNVWCSYIHFIFVWYVFRVYVRESKRSNLLLCWRQDDGAGWQSLLGRVQAVSDAIWWRGTAGGWEKLRVSARGRRVWWVSWSRPRYRPISPPTETFPGLHLACWRRLESWSQAWLEYATDGNESNCRWRSTAGREEIRQPFGLVPWLRVRYCALLRTMADRWARSPTKHAWSRRTIVSTDSGHMAGAPTDFTCTNQLGIAGCHWLGIVADDPYGFRGRWVRPIQQHNGRCLRTTPNWVHLLRDGDEDLLRTRIGVGMRGLVPRGAKRQWRLGFTTVDSCFRLQKLSQIWNWQKKTFVRRFGLRTIRAHTCMV